MNAIIRQKLANSKRRIERRLDKTKLDGCDKPMFTVSDDTLLPVCNDCLRAEMPQLLVRHILAGHDGDCAMECLREGLQEFKAEFWEAAADYLHLGEQVQDDEDDGDEAEDDDTRDESVGTARFLNA